MLRIEDLSLNGLKIYQDDELYCFTSDAVLLSKFAMVKHGDIVADFCSGSGIVGLHLYGLNAEKIKSVTLFEMQKSLYDLSVKSIELNNLTDKFTAVNTKLQDITSDYNEKFSLIVCNPPYGERLSDEKEVRALMAEFGKTFRSLPDWKAYILTSLPDFERYFGKSADKKKKLFNANLVCGFYCYFVKPPRENK